MARRVETWLRVKMTQQRFNNVAILNAHKTRTNVLRLVSAANEFVGRNDNSKRNFGTFTGADLIHIATRKWTDIVNEPEIGPT